MKFLSSLKNKDLSNKTALLRVDLNINGNNLKNSLRIKGILPTIKYLVDNEAKVVILSHKGRPPRTGSKITSNDIKRFSLKPFSKILSQKLKNPVVFLNFIISGQRLLSDFDIKKIENSPIGSVFLLDNLRFFSCETENSAKFARELTSYGDFYINDAFSVSHRANASVAAITKFIPSYAGFLLEKEIKNLNKARNFKKGPFVIVLGGAKISDKIGLIKSFLEKADYFLIGGGMANTFIASKRLPIGNSLYENHMIPVARDLLKQAEKKLILPRDVIMEDRKILDIGPETIKKYAEIIKKAKTVIWNGPMGYFEDERFRNGSKEIMKAIMKSRAFSAVGGGETISLFQSARNYVDITRNGAEKFRVSQRQVRENPLVFLSTGGGAMLEYLAGKKLPGIEALK